MTTRYTSVREVMSERPIMIDGLATVREAVETMRRHGVGSLVIDKRFPGDEYGVLFVTDIAENVIAKDRSADRVNVYEIMTKPVVTIDASMNVRYAIRLLQRLSLSRALVVESGRLVGIATLRELVLAFLGAGRSTAAAQEEYDHARSLLPPPSDDPEPDPENFA